MTGARGRWVLLAGLMAAGCGAEPQPFAQTASGLPPIGPGAARLFVYRDVEYYKDLAYIPIFLDSRTVGAVGPGKIMERDVAVGTHTLEAKSEALWPGQLKTVRFAAGDTVYAKVESFLSGDPSTTEPDLISTFVIVLIDAETARREMSGLILEAARPDRPGG